MTEQTQNFIIHLMDNIENTLENMSGLVEMEAIPKKELKEFTRVKEKAKRFHKELLMDLTRLNIKDISKAIE